MTDADVPVKPAATVMLLRDGADGVEVFMLRRTNRAVFAGGMYVFPGGKVDPGDGDGDLGYVVAAIRECYEEAGVLLAVDANGQMVSDTHPALDHRDDVYSGTLDMRALAAAHGLTLATDQLAWVSRWVTPRGESTRRFDTRFYVTAMPPGQSSYHDDNETVESLWVTPHAALAGDLLLMPPTIANLKFVRPHSTAASAIEAARRIGIPTPVLPQLRMEEDGRIAGVLMPGDPGYDETAGAGA